MKLTGARLPAKRNHEPTVKLDLSAVSSLNIPTDKVVCVGGIDSTLWAIHVDIYKLLLSLVNSINLFLYCFHFWWMLRMVLSTSRLHTVFFFKFIYNFPLVDFMVLKIIFKFLIHPIYFGKSGDRNLLPNFIYSIFLHFPYWIEMYSLSYYKIF